MLARLIIFRLKSDSHILCFNESPLYIFKALFVLRYLNFCPDFFGHLGKWLDKKAKLISKSMTPQTGKQILTIHILPNTSISKGNQTIKFGQLIGLKVINIFLKKLPLYLRKTSGLYLISLYFDSPRLGYTIKTTCIKLQAVDPRYV